MRFTHIFFDIGGVLGTNGWDHEQRNDAIKHFGLDQQEFEYRHRETVGPLEEGRLSMWDYLDVTVFYQPRDFDHRTFVDYMIGLSRPNIHSIAIVAELARDPRLRLM